MSLKIRMARSGRKNVACYRVVVADSHSKRDGKFVEIVGTYDPQVNPKKFSIKEDRIAHWIKLGATPSDTVANLMKQDRYAEKVEARAKGVAAEDVKVERKPERKRKQKQIKAKKAS